MKDVFLVFGYGVPKNILKDENYGLYLKAVFNKIYDVVAKNKSVRPLVIFCGGKTDMYKPYKRTEAQEMIRFFSAMIKKRKFLKVLTKDWILIPEKNTLSTLESLINSQKVVRKHKIKKANFFIFCEQTRGNRVKILAKKVLKKDYHFQVLPIDFDMSANRYLPLGFLAKKEKESLKHSLRAFQSPENLKKHHGLCLKGIKYLRKAEPHAHVKSVQKWWELELGQACRNRW